MSAALAAALPRQQQQAPGVWPIVVKEQSKIQAHHRRVRVRAPDSAQHTQAAGCTRCTLDERHYGMRSSRRERVPFGGIPHTHTEHTPRRLHRLALCCICACRHRRVRARARLAQRLRASNSRRCPGPVLYASINFRFCFYLKSIKSALGTTREDAL